MDLVYKTHTLLEANKKAGQKAGDTFFSFS